MVVLNSSCYQQKERFIGDNQDIISISTDKNTQLADGSSSVTITATINSEKIDNTGITFTTNDGVFNNHESIYSTDAKKQGDKYIAIAKITSNKPNGNVQIAVNASGFKAQTAVSFTNAYPEAVIIESTQASTKKVPDSTIKLSAKLKRSTGTPSIGQKVTFVASYNGKPVQGFHSTDAGSSTEGVVNTVFIVRDTSILDSTGKHDILTITATATGVDSTLTNSMNFILTEK